MRKVIVFFCTLLIFIACNDENALEKKISRIDVPFQLQRFDIEFATSEAADLPVLKAKYPYLFPQQFADSVWIQKSNDPLFQELYWEVNQTFGDFEKETATLKSIFQHVKYYFPEVNIPKVVTVISEVDLENKVIWTDSLLLISTDTYLGENHRFYEGIPEYTSNEMSPEFLPVDVSLAFAQYVVPAPKGRQFIETMAYWGKIRYLISVLYPEAGPHLWLHYNEQAYDWAMNNEAYIWMYFIEKELLYKTDPNLSERFIAKAPFSKFYLEIDNESPGRIGQYLGWRIVDAFMQNNDVSLQEMLQTDATTLFEKSKFKPYKS
ncbi:MAG: gliding motility lipoprotein GldB [Flavobacteriaceae bacterium]|nr:gliding motility lipoprotein GldB [Flavobacteriaceae bacterium]